MRDRSVGKPLSNSYWVEPGRLLAGEYPGAPSQESTVERVNRLLEAGITYFLDLTEPGERPAYENYLPAGLGPGGREVEHVRKPLRDHSIPAEPGMMAEILSHLEGALADGHRVYVHCRAGIGRTGTVIGCYLVQTGMTSDEALDHLQRLWEDYGMSRVWPQTPETDEQVAYVRGWRPQFDPVAPDSRPDLLDRYRGALLGLAIGDALGSSVQGQAPGTFPPVRDLTGGGPFNLPRGAWTDDTAMALCLAESLLERHSFDLADQASRYWRWLREGHLSSTARCIGITQTVSRALATAQWSGKPYTGSHDPNRLDKEPLTRVAPVVLYFASHPAEAIELAAEAARITHQSPGVLDGCRYFAMLLLQALAGVEKQDLGRSISLERPWKEPIATLARTVASGALRDAHPSRIQGGGTLVQVLEAAVWALQRSRTFQEGALLVVNLGRDADVTGALYGQLAGALYGASHIPADWRDTLLKRELIVDFADRLLSRN